MKSCYRSSASLSTALFPKLLAQCSALIDVLWDAELPSPGGWVSPVLLFCWEPSVGPARAYLVFVGENTICCFMGLRFQQSKPCSRAGVWGGEGARLGARRALKACPQWIWMVIHQFILSTLLLCQKGKKRKKKERKEKTYKIRFVSLI